jgi:hypothetical protein
MSEQNSGESNQKSFVSFDKNKNNETKYVANNEDLDSIDLNNDINEIDSTLVDIDKYCCAMQHLLSQAKKKNISFLKPYLAHDTAGNAFIEYDFQIGKTKKDKSVLTLLINKTINDANREQIEDERRPQLLDSEYRRYFDASKYFKTHGIKITIPKDRCQMQCELDVSEKFIHLQAGLYRKESAGNFGFSLFDDNYATQFPYKVDLNSVNINFDKNKGMIIVELSYEQ